MKRGVLSDAVRSFFGTYLELDERNRREEDHKAEQRWKDFYMEHLSNQESRAAESHAQEMERWETEKESLLRESAARDQFFKEYQMTPEAWSMMAPVEQFEMARQNFEMAREMHNLNKTVLEFDFDMKKKTAPYDLARAKALATGTGGRGGGDGDPVAALQKEWELYDKRRTSLWRSIEDQYKTVTGEVDVERAAAENPMLWNSYVETSAHWNMLSDELNQVRGGAMGLPIMERTGSDGPGSSEAVEQDPFAEIRPQSEREKRGPTPLQRAMGSALAPVLPKEAKGVVYVDPNDGNIQWTNDPNVAAQLQKQGATLLNPEDVPRRWYGRSYQAFQEEKRNPTPLLSHPASWWANSR